MPEENNKQGGGRGFAADRERAREAGRKGGKARHEGDKGNQDNKEEDRTTEDTENM